MGARSSRPRAHPARRFAQAITPARSDCPRDHARDVCHEGATARDSCLARTLRQRRGPFRVRSCRSRLREGTGTNRVWIVPRIGAQRRPVRPQPRDRPAVTTCSRRAPPATSRSAESRPAPGWLDRLDHRGDDRCESAEALRAAATSAATPPAWPRYIALNAQRGDDRANCGLPRPPPLAAHGSPRSPLPK